LLAGDVIGLLTNVTVFIDSMEAQNPHPHPWNSTSLIVALILSGMWFMRWRGGAIGRTSELRVRVL